MSALNTPLEIYKLLNKSNCKKCMLPSCLAFAAAVIAGAKKFSDCPDLDCSQMHVTSKQVSSGSSFGDEQQGLLNIMKGKIGTTGLFEFAEKKGGRMVGDRLAINCLGKDFLIDSRGELSSECHNNLWVHGPLLDYIVNGKGKKPTGTWLPFQELEGASDWGHFFSHRCEDEMLKLADAHPELFFELLELFGADHDVGQNADYSILLHPLPMVPMSFNYWLPEDEFPSKLTLLFDETTPDNLNPELIYTLSRGLVEMFRVLIVKHNLDGNLF